MGGLRVSKQGYVYVAIDKGSPGLCKVGQTNNVAERERTLNGGSPKATIKIVKYVHVDDMDAIESAFHEILYYQAEKGEWFNIEEDRVLPMLECFAKLDSNARPVEDASGSKVAGRGGWHEDGWRMHCEGAAQAEIAKKFGVTQSAVSAMKKKMRGAGRGSEEVRLSAPRRGRKVRQGAGATPQSAFRQPIIDVLKELGGGGQAKDVLERVERRMRKQLNQADYKPLKKGQKIWVNKAQWMRLKLKDERILKSDSPHGWWELA